LPGPALGPDADLRRALFGIDIAGLRLWSRSQGGDLDDLVLLGTEAREAVQNRLSYR